MTVKILIGADIVPTKSNLELFAKGDRQKLIGDGLSNEFQSADLTILNLETPLTDYSSPIQKCGPNLIAPTKTITGLKAINPCFFTLANNHILDQGEHGLVSTLALLEKYGIACAGAGKNLSEASRPYIYTNGHLKIGVYCCAENEFTIASNETAGANPFDPLESLDHINALKSECSFVIVLYHGGKEHYRYPSPYLQKICRKIVDSGADLVVCQHSHCIGCWEKWDNAMIVYGQGNFLFDNSESEFWKTSILIKLIFDVSSVKIDWIPLQKKGNIVREATGEDGNRILHDYNERSEQIQVSGFIQAEYSKFSKKMIDTYHFTLLGRVSSFILFHVFNKLSGHRMTRHIFSGQKRLNLLNIVDCEAHRELLISGLKEEFKRLR